MIALDMQPVPVIEASIGSPFAIAAVRSPSETWSTGPVTDATTPSAARRLARELGGVGAGADRLDAAHLGRDARRASRPRPRSRAATAISTSSRIRRAVSVRYAVAPAPTGSSTTGTPRGVRRPAGGEHRLDPVRRERPDVEHERAGEPDHLLDLLGRMRHHRQRAERERRVRGLVHDHVVRDLVDERPVGTEARQRRARAHGDTAGRAPRGAVVVIGSQLMAVLSG